MPGDLTTTLRSPARLLGVGAGILLPLALVAQAPPGGRTLGTSEKVDVLPLAPTRTVEFTTDEGTWMSLDVSPDGRTIVFDLLGDLYTLPIAGGTATRITEGPAIDVQPRYSPDGTTIVFVSDRSGGENVWLMDAAGTHPRALTANDNNQFISPEWTPDGGSILVSRNTESFFASNYDLYRYSRNGGEGVKLPGVARFDNYLGAAFSKDPQSLYVAAKKGGGYGHYIAFPTWQIAVSDRDGKDLRVLTNAQGSAMRPVLSPDGRTLVYATRRDSRTALKLRDLQTDEETWLAPDVQRDEQESVGALDMVPGSAFTPDGKSLIVSHHGKFWRIDVPSGQATAIPFTAAVRQQLGPLVKFEHTRDDGPLTVQQIRDPRMSPDGKRLAFTALDRLYVMDLPDGTPKRLTPETDGVGEFMPGWSPDGRYLAYVTWANRGGDVYRVATTGAGKPERLTTQTAYYKRPVYAPDGQTIFVSRGQRQPRLERGFDTGLTLMSLPAGGGPLTLITRASTEDLHYSSDPTRVYTFDFGEGLVSMKLDGSDRTPHLKVTGYSPGGVTSVRQILISPDGTRAIAQANSNVYLLTMPLPPAAGGKVPVVSVVNPAAASVPVKQITRIAGEFLGWQPDGRAFYYALGRSFFTYDLAEAERSPDYQARRLDIRIVVPRDAPTGSVVLRGARIVTMRGDEILERGDVVVTGNRIAAVGAQGAVTTPAGARVIDVAGKTILPGWFDIHSHPRSLPWGVHQRQNQDLLALLAFGVTTHFNPQTTFTDAVTYTDMVEAGDILAPRSYSAGPGIMFGNGIGSLEDARNVLRRYADFYGVTRIKEYGTGDRKVRQWVMMAARELRLNVTAEGYMNMKHVLGALLDGFTGREHSFPVVPLFKDYIQLAAQSGITYTPTLVALLGGPVGMDYFFAHYDVHGDQKVRRFMPHDEVDRKSRRRNFWYHDEEHTIKDMAAGAAKILAAGGRVGLGAHGEMQGLGTHWELWALASGGMRLHDVVRVGTALSADALGLGKDLGSLEAGKLADLQVLDANPLADIRNTHTIRYVMKNGRLYAGDTLKEIWPRQRELERPWWWDDEPGSSGGTSAPDGSRR